MARCEDFPCCGHELGCCPDFDESGRQLNMVCVCGAKLPVDNPSSLCNHCLREDDEFAIEYGDYDDEDDCDDQDYEREPYDDHFADAMETPLGQEYEGIE